MVEGTLHVTKGKDESGFMYHLKRQILKTIPILCWLPNYQWKNHLIRDLLAGLSLACISVPQGLAFAFVANVDPIYGLNTACFATFFYTLFGTATISSFGPVAIASMLVGEAVAACNFDELPYSKEEYVATLTLCIGLCYLVGWFLRLGSLTYIFQKPFIAGFLAASVSTILIKYTKLCFGITIPSHSGYYSLYYNIIDLIGGIGNYTNIPTLIISVVVLVVFSLNSAVLAPFAKKRCSCIIPIEIIVITIVGLLSYIFDFQSMGVPIVGFVPSGLPKVFLPVPSAILSVLPQAIPIAIINYSTSTSMVKLFNNSHDPSQDMLAMGITNMICCNIQCITIGNSIMRTMIATGIGLKSLLASTFSSFFLFVVILFCGPLFEPLPSCILGCIIMIAAAKLLYQRIMDVKKFYKSPEDLIIFFSAYIFTLVFDLVMGLLVGGVLSLGKILRRAEKDEKLKREAESIKTLGEMNNQIEQICHL